MTGSRLLSRPDLLGTHRIEPTPAPSAPLGQLTFLPYYRRGAVAGCVEPFEQSLESRARVVVHVPLRASGGPSQSADAVIEILGPGDVVGLDRAQIIRRFPSPGSGTVEPNVMVHCEFDSPDLPWLFTPSGPIRGTDHLPPWLMLVCVPSDLLGRDPIVRPPDRPGLPPQTTLPTSELPDPAEAWAWAHAQVLGGDGPAESVVERLGPKDPAVNLSRIICPRKLGPNTAWTALLVPTFKVGAQAGLGAEAEVRDLHWAWTLRAETVSLPVYDSWEFSTGADEDFERLAERLEAQAPPPDFGQREVDLSQPDPSFTPTPPAVRPAIILGPLVASHDERAGAAGSGWDAATTATLEERLSAADAASHDAGRPVIGPPLYAAAHVARTQVPEPGTEPVWFRELNLEPTDRAVAGLGAAVVQMDQEALMAGAWAQYGQVLAANDALRAAQFGLHVGARAHVRHVRTLPVAPLLAVTRRAQSRLSSEPGRTVWAAVAASATPPAVVGSTMRRLLRPAGPLARFATTADAAADSVVARVSSVASLLADADVSADWVRAAHPPDGARGLASETLDMLRSTIGDTATSDETRTDLARDSILDDPRTLREQLRMADTSRPVAELVLERLLRAIPTSADAGELSEAQGWEIVAMVQEFQALAARGQWAMEPGALARFDDQYSGLDTPLVEIGGGSLAELMNPTLDRLRETFGIEPDRQRRHQYSDLVEQLVAQSGEGWLHDVDALVAGLGQAPAAPERRVGLNVPQLDLVGQLDPARTVLDRMAVRLPTIDAVAPDWTVDRNSALDQIMVAPRFGHPMAEALYRYAPEWLLPGLAKLSPNEIITALTVNARFLEAFLIGCNHEFARELVWRGYPTDGRATSFRSFWTEGGSDLVADVHTLTGELGTHTAANLKDAVVLVVRGELVRRYPEVIALAARQTNRRGEPPIYGPPAPVLFRQVLPPDLLLVGFDVRAPDMLDADRLWWVTLSEHVGEPRFGLDIPGTAPGPDAAAARQKKRDDLTWADWDLDRDRFLTGRWPRLQVIDRPGDPGAPLGSAMMAWLLFQQPVRAGFQGAPLLSHATPHPEP